MTWRNHSITRIATIPIILIVLAGLLLLLPEPRERVLDLFSVSDQTGAGDTHYTCPMHPDIRLGQMGDCPICGMSLVEKAGTDEEQTVTVTVTPQAAQLTGITVEPVQWRELHKEIDTYGTIDYDETRLGVVSAWVGGRIDRLFIDFTGVTINKGHPLVEMYSPELISSEREYVLALENLRRVRESDFGDAASNAEALVNSTRQRLLWMGLSEQQLDEIAESGELDERIMVYAPRGGTVIDKKAYPGMYVKEGDVLFHIADLSRVWLYADIYEDEIPFLYQERPGDYYECTMHPSERSDSPGTCSVCGMDFIRANRSVTVAIEPRAFPGETFEGYISFTDPFLNRETRTVRVRVNVDNPEVRLKPGMFARVRIRLPAGRMLAVPENAVIHSGKRTIVLVEESKGTFQPTLVRLGRMWLAEDNPDVVARSTLSFKRGALRFHEVLDGLDPDARVVTSGNFLLGSESQLQGALARMLADEREHAHDDEERHHEHAGPWVEEEAFDVLLGSYLAMSEKLADDNVEGIAELAQKIAANASNERIREAAAATGEAAAKNDIDRTRYSFRHASDVMIAYIEAHSAELGDKPNKVYCPMADASWLQKGTTIANPYYGASMLRCGRIEPWDGQ